MIRFMFVAIIIILSTSGCSIPIRKVRLDDHTVSRLKTPVRRAGRSVRFIECVKELNYEGFKQSLIKELCEAGLGSIN